MLITAIPNVKLYLLETNNKNEYNKFGEINIITGKYDYEEVIRVRNNDNKYGEDAIFLKKITLNLCLLEHNKLIFLLSYITFLFIIK